ncbi:histidine kinase [Acrodontium crateriforme]|uniref:Histidine kinase n=1 Tax=Acrodontium crateriforme TaxID=150365 RepID=A0AAQ3M9Y9_9PEZI|nr:histidine kinase [Acrodontium crateriforme]
MAPSSLLSLPPELCSTLIRFFDSDDRPSLLLETGLENDPPTYETTKRWYGNHAFKSSEKGQPFDLKAILKALEQNLTQSGTFPVNGRNWKLRPLGQPWWALVDIGERMGQDKGEHHTPNGANGSVTSDGDLKSSEAGLEKFGAPAQLDWTRHPLPNPSPWIDLLRNHDWASTAIGAMDQWSESLRQHVVSITVNPMPRLLVWGDDMTFLYNEACVPLFGDKHPRALGEHVTKTWQEIWDTIGPIVRNAYQGKVTSLQRMQLPIIRHGFLEETFWDFNMLPIVEKNGQTIGITNEIFESSVQVRSERRRASTLTMSNHISSASTIEQLWSTYLEGMKHAVDDVAFSYLYAVQNDIFGSRSDNSGLSPHISKKCILHGTVGTPEDHPSLVQSFQLLESLEGKPGIVKACVEAWKTGEVVALSCDDGSLPAELTIPIPGRGSEDPIRNAIVAPITSYLGHEILGIVVIGLNPRSPYDDDYRLWVDLVFDLLGKAASLVTLPEEQRRAQKIADDINSSLAQQLRMTTLQAEKSEEKFSRMAAAAPLGMFVFDAEGMPLHLNDTYIEMLGDTREEHFARYGSSVSPWETYVHPDDLPKFEDAWKSILEKKLPVTIEYRLKKPWKSIDRNTGNQLSGESWLLANAFPEVDADGKVSTIQGWLTDISYSKFSEKLLGQRLADALENKVKTENFIDMTSHEMRNPLSAILQSADSIISFLNTPSLLKPRGSLDGVPDENVVHEILDAADTIILCAQHQKRIVDDILTLSKLDASLLVISPDTVQPPTLVMKALKMYEAEVTRANIQTRVIIEPSYAELGVDWVILDSSRLLQVIINLLTNSIKFTYESEKREITIYIGASYDKPTGKHHGVDFIPTRQPRKELEAQPQWGDGEDLYLQIAVTDTGRGLSEDEIKLLFQRFSQASPKTYKQYGGSGLGLFISRELCELQGGQIGVSSAKGKTTFTFFVRTKKFIEQSLPAESTRPPLHRYTSAAANPIAFYRRGSEVMKPSTLVKREMQVMTGTISEVEGHPKADMISAETQTSPYTIEVDIQSGNDIIHVLIVEDNQINSRVMSQQLTRAGCKVHIANHGLECLKFLETTTFCTSKTPLSVILLDLEMPTMDGMTCIRHIREQQKNGKIISHVPVIAVTANARAEQIKSAIDAGMDRVVTKPFRIPELIPQMQELIKEIEQKGEFSRSG